MVLGADCEEGEWQSVVNGKVVFTLPLAATPYRLCYAFADEAPVLYEQFNVTVFYLSEIQIDDGETRPFLTNFNLLVLGVSVPAVVSNGVELGTSTNLWAVRDLLSGRIMLQGMEGSTLGVWVAHGEGRCFWPDDAVKEEAMRQNCVVLKYVDDDGNVTMGYPMNPNGSEGAVVGLTSPNYRHL
ncbi:hypothetical protein BLSTO_03592 [Blastocystis sp. subtype 1]